MAPTITLIRHAQGYHNLFEDWTIFDPKLTELGNQQCEDVRHDYPHHNKVTHIFASPLFRTIETALYSFKPAIDRGIQIVMMPEVQECDNDKCNRGHSPDEIKKKFRDVVNVDNLSPGWYDKSSGSPYEPTGDKLRKRALNARKMIRDVVITTGDDACIVVVTHGQFLRYLTKLDSPWKNAEWELYTIMDDDEATLLPSSDDL